MLLRYCRSFWNSIASVNDGNRLMKQVTRPNSEQIEIGIKSFAQALFQTCSHSFEQSVDFCQCCVRMIVVVHKTMLTQSGAANVVQHFPCHLQGGLAIVNSARDLLRSPLKRTEQTPFLGVRRACSIIRSVPRLFI